MNPGDTVKHVPTGEEWLVLRVDEKHVYPAGWPSSRALREDCVLLRKGTDTDRATIAEGQP